MATKLSKAEKAKTKALLADAKQLAQRQKEKAAAKAAKQIKLPADFKPYVPSRTPAPDTSRRPSSRAFASNKAVIDTLVAPEKTNINYPSTMSGSRDSQRKAFADNKTGASKNYKMVNGKMVEISEAEWNQAAKKFVKQEGTGRGTIKAGQTTANPSRMDVLKKAVAKVQGKKGVDTGLSAAERKMAREGIAPPRKPATPPTAAPAAKVEKAGGAAKMSRAERSAANKAKHAVVRAAEEKKWAEQKAAKTGKAASAPTVAEKPAPAKAVSAKPASKPATTPAPKPAAKPATSPAPKTATAKPATTAKPKSVATAKPAPAATASKAPNLTAQGEARAAGVRERANAYRLNQSVRGAQARMAERAATSKQGFVARNFPNVTTVVREGLASKAGRTAALQAGKNIATGLLSRGNVALTALTYSKGLNEGEDAYVRARNQARLDEWRKVPSTGPTNPRGRAKPAGARQAPASAVSRGGSRPVQKPAAAPVSAPKKVAAVRKTSAAATSPTPTANPQKAIADFEAKLRSAGAISIAGGVGGKPSMIPQASEMTAKQLEERFKKVKGPR